MKTLDQICEEQGYAAAKAEADRRGVVWFASTGAKRKPRTAPVQLELFGVATPICQ